MITKEYMTDMEFFDLAKRMVVEYYNRYVHNSYERVIDIHEVELLGIDRDGDNNKSIEMVVVADDSLVFVVEYNPTNKKKPISSYVRWN